MHYIRLWREPWRRIPLQAIKQWHADRGEARRSDTGFLTAGDVVLDFGGFQGEWTAQIRRKHDCSVHIFEPHPSFAAGCRARFSDDRKVFIHAHALGTSFGPLPLSDAGDASSALTQTAGGTEGRVVKAADFLKDISPPVALAKINIEGGEYDLFPALQYADWIRHIGVLQIQFHLYSEADIARRATIRATLSKTHICDWEYPFVWEQWSLRR